MNETLKPTREQAITAARQALTDAGHTPWTSLDNPADEPRFVVYYHDRRVTVSLNYAAPTADRAKVFAAYAADLTAAGMAAEAGDNRVRVLVSVRNTGTAG
jgi:hypothetical protein